MDKFCCSCSMPMKEKKDFAIGDNTKDFCCYCSDKNGNLKSYEDVLEGWTTFLVKSENITKEEALLKVKREMKKLPAWKKRHGGCGCGCSCNGE